MSYPSGATPTVSTTLGGGKRWCPLPERGDPAVWESPMESLLEGLPGPQTMDGPAIMGNLVPANSLQNFREQRNQGKGIQTKARPRLYHGTPLPWHPGELDQSEGTRGDIVRSLETQTSPPGLDRTSSKSAPSPRCGWSIPRVSAPVWTRCMFLIWDTRDVNCPQWEQFPLGPQEDLARQPVQGAREQNPLVVDVRDHRRIVCAH